MISGVFGGLASRRNKLLPVQEAVSLIKSHDTLTVSGFVSQGCPECLLRHVGSSSDVFGLTVLFEGGPGDYATKGINHLAVRPGLLSRSIGAHYGQVPKLAELALADKVAAYALPMGSVSRMLRSASNHTPGHITRVGLGTFVDPRLGGGKLNAKAKAAGELVKLVELDGVEYLQYSAIPVRVALIRASTSDPAGNLSFERESLLTDAKLMCMAAKASGGIVIAQVSRVVQVGMTLSRECTFLPRGLSTDIGEEIALFHIPTQRAYSRCVS